jgi:hypothetical protein
MAKPKPNMNTHRLVRNVRGSGNLVPGCCPTWIQHYDAHSTSRAKSCSALTCSEDATVGAHVVSLDNRTGGQHWIVPTCHPCNMRIDDFYLKSYVALVSSARCK